MKFASYEPNRIRIFRCSCVKNFRESYVFHCLVIKVLNSPSLRQLIYFITFTSACQVLFSSFFRGVLMSVCRSQATCLLYHISVPLSTIFMLFSKLFKLFNQKKQFLVTAQLEYHFPTELSTLFFIIYNYSS